MDSVPAVLMVYLAAAAGYAGFQWTVHVVVYRQFSAVPPASFGAYERSHQRRISFVVGPLFAALVGAAGWLIIERPMSLVAGRHCADRAGRVDPAGDRAACRPAAPPVVERMG